MKEEGPRLVAQEPTLIQIRERSYLDLLDLALLVIRHRPRRLALAAVIGIAPFAALNFWLLSNPDFSRALWPVLLFLEAPWATAPLTVVLGGLMFGQPPGFGSVLRRLVVALPALFLMHVIVRCGLTITMILFWLVPARLWFASEVILLERSSGWKAIGRSFQLTRDRPGEFVLRWLGQLFFGLVFALCFWLGTSAVAKALFESELTWERPVLTDTSGLRFQLGVWIAIAFFAVGRFLIYIDERIRGEGWEVRLRLQAAIRELERSMP
jgi:hypothetical protein